MGYRLAIAEDGGLRHNLDGCAIGPCFSEHRKMAAIVVEAFYRRLEEDETPISS